MFPDDFLKQTFLLRLFTASSVCDFSISFSRIVRVYFADFDALSENSQVYIHIFSFVKLNLKPAWKAPHTYDGFSYLHSNIVLPLFRPFKRTLILTMVKESSQFKSSFCNWDDTRLQNTQKRLKIRVFPSTC